MPGRLLNPLYALPLAILAKVDDVHLLENDRGNVFRQGYLFKEILS